VAADRFARRSAHAEGDGIHGRSGHRAATAPSLDAGKPKGEPVLRGYPEAVARPWAARQWFNSYVQTYLERNVRAVTAVKDLATFRRVLALVAGRHGQVLNKTDFAAPLGVSVPTITQWLGVLETTAQFSLCRRSMRMWANA
jgi:uncharacterized protein